MFCGATHPIGYFCNRHPNHDGAHVARDLDDREHARWTNADDIVLAMA